ncbi:hypothetical protein RJ639_003031 [Escallonia herrerae]|uniref:VQ domain-containing protein n=1 Tax=Escallonia herrerae TaxID=1293975 RepID=A0AA89AY19_9ASTE|nr:hypothetical protein RJ639_003031 [Escallonia herrerae]
MSPRPMFDDNEQQGGIRVINGPRPSPLKISRFSSTLKKPNRKADRGKPVIIYAKSPKIIHAQARDFMSLVQKLTGMSSRSGSKETARSERESKEEGNSLEGNNGNSESSSGVTDEKQYGGGGRGKEATSSSVSPLFRAHNSFLADIPLFTPNSSDFFSSPRPLFRYSDMATPSPNMASPSFMEAFMKSDVSFNQAVSYKVDTVAKRAAFEALACGESTMKT